MKCLKLMLVLLVLMPSLSWPQTYELTNVDILSLKELILPENITIYGFNLKSPLSDVLSKFGKNINDGEKGDDGYFYIFVKPGLRIRSKDKNSIDEFIIYEEFRANLKGRTASLFAPRSSEEFKSFLKMHLGEPDKFDPLRLAGAEFDSAVYLQGLIFRRVFDRKNISIMFEITTMENAMAEIR